MKNKWFNNTVANTYYYIVLIKTKLFKCSVYIWACGNKWNSATAAPPPPLRLQWHRLSNFRSYTRLKFMPNDRGSETIFRDICERSTRFWRQIVRIVVGLFILGIFMKILPPPPESPGITYYSLPSTSFTIFLLPVKLINCQEVMVTLL